MPESSSSQLPTDPAQTVGRGGVLPPAFGIWVLGWLGLRSAAEAEGPVGVTAGLVLAALGVWVLRGWVRILELHRLAETMALDLSDDTPEPS
ncbi:MAG: hypothetical protein Q8N53_07950 [Longimicrobiales bacterium]|nr:hypothetical protein [Longimicrobiales bacterium]